MSRSHLVWVCCSAHSEGRTGWSSPARSTAVRPSRRSCDCPVLPRTRCTQSARGATPSPELSPPAQAVKSAKAGGISFISVSDRNILAAHLSYYWLLTGRTVSLRGCLDSLSAQVRLEEPQHAVQRASRWRLRRGGGLLRRCNHWSDGRRWLREDKAQRGLVCLWDFNAWINLSSLDGCWNWSLEETSMRKSPITTI